MERVSRFIKSMAVFFWLVVSPWARQGRDVEDGIPLGVAILMNVFCLALISLFIALAASLLVDYLHTIRS